jgi:hypothetical protein
VLKLAVALPSNGQVVEMRGILLQGLAIMRHSCCATCTNQVLVVHMRRKHWVELPVALLLALHFNQCRNIHFLPWILQQQRGRCCVGGGGNGSLFLPQRVWERWCLVLVKLSPPVACVSRSSFSPGLIFLKQPGMYNRSGDAVQLIFKSVNVVFQAGRLRRLGSDALAQRLGWLESGRLEDSSFIWNAGWARLIVFLSTTQLHELAP